MAAVRGRVPEPRLARNRSGVVAGAGWYLLGLAGLLLDSGESTVGQSRASFVLSVAALLFGLWVYWRHGGSRVTAVGIYNFAFALFVGFAGLHILFWGSADVPIVSALAWCYFGNVTAWLLFWTKDRSPEPSRPMPIDPVLLRQVTWLGVIVACVGSILSIWPSSSLRDPGLAIGFAGILLVSIGLLSDDRRSPVLGCLLAVGGFVVSVAAATGDGRLILGSLGLALLIVMSRRLSRRLVKATVIAASVPVLLLFAEMRQDPVQENLSGRELTGTGLESMASPLEVFAILLDQYEMGFLSQAWGHTFWVALISLVPRALWATKPVGFGAELVWILHPELAYTGHSDAALFQGEWLYNFGVVGLVLMVPVVGFAVWSADRFLEKAAARLDSPRALLGYATAITVAACLPNLVWVGTFTFVVRAGMRAAVLVGVVFLLAGMKRR